MSEPQRGVVIFHGEDEFGIAQAVALMEEGVGDPSLAMLNITRLDGRNLSLEELSNSARAIPFLASRRLVVVTQACQRLSSPAQREVFIKVLDNLAETTQLVLVEYQTLPGNHWLMEWARHAGAKVFVRAYGLKKGTALVKWIEEQTGGLGGQITPQAAAVLASLMGDDSRMAYQEIQKLLTYVGSRPVEADDVTALSAFSGEANIFALVDALGNQDSKKASGVLRLLLAEQEPLQIFAMVVRQFRLLLLTREIMDEGGRMGDVVQKLHLANYVAERVMAQARHFSQETLEMVYHQLLELDDGIKTGLYEGDAALEMFVPSFTSRKELRSH